MILSRRNRVEAPNIWRQPAIPRDLGRLWSERNFSAAFACGLQLHLNILAEVGSGIQAHEQHPLC